jgi:hypothetical protein
MHRTPDEILVNFLNEWEKISAEYAAKNPFYKKVIESQKKYAETIVPYRLSWYPNHNFAGEYTGRTRSTCRRPAQVALRVPGQTGARCIYNRRLP